MIEKESDMTPDYMEMAKAELVDVLLLLKDMRNNLESVLEDKDGRDI